MVTFCSFFLLLQYNVEWNAIKYRLGNWSTQWKGRVLKHQKTKPSNRLISWLAWLFDGVKKLWFWLNFTPARFILLHLKGFDGFVIWDFSTLLFYKIRIVICILYTKIMSFCYFRTLNTALYVLMISYPNRLLDSYSCNISLKC